MQVRQVNLLEIRHIEDADTLQCAYDNLYHIRPIRHLGSFYRWILRLVCPEPGKRLLDVACGQGVVSRMAAEMGVEAYGFDLSALAVREGRGTGAGLAVANGENLPYPDGAFDYITNIGSLEHYEDPVVGVQEMSRVLAPDGLACVLLPNTFGLGNILFAWHYGRTADDGQPIQRYAARFEWQDLLEANGLVVTKTVKYESVWPRSWADAVWYLRRPKAFIILLTVPFLPLNLTSCFVYLCRRA